MTNKKITAEQLQRFIKKIIKEQMEEAGKVQPTTWKPELSLKQKQVVQFITNKAKELGMKKLPKEEDTDIVNLYYPRGGKTGVLATLYWDEFDNELCFNFGGDYSDFSGNDPLRTKKDIQAALSWIKKTIKEVEYNLKAGDEDN